MRIDQSRMLVVECNTGYLTSLERKLDDAAEVGEWLDQALSDIYEYCGERNIFPCVHVKALLMSQNAADRLEVEEFLFDVQRTSQSS